MFALISGKKLLKHKKEVVWITCLQGQAYILHLPVISYIKKWNTYVTQILFQVKEVKRISNSKCCHQIYCISNLYSQKGEQLFQVKEVERIYTLEWPTMSILVSIRKNLHSHLCTYMHEMWKSKINCYDAEHSKNIKLHQKDAMWLKTNSYIVSGPACNAWC